MFSMAFNSSRKSPTLIGEMNCCSVQTGRRQRHSWWQGASGCVGSGALLVLLPKCPMCIAAYLTLWTGAGVAMSIATHLGPMLEILFVASAVLLVVRQMAMGMR
jgi:hypothetical protein